MAFDNHGIEDIGDELEAGTSFGAMILAAEREVASGEFGGEFDVSKPKLVEAGFITQDGDVIIETFDIGEVPGVIEEIAVTKSIFETVGGEARNIVVGDGEEFVIGNFAGENAVFFELAGDGAGITDDFASASFNGLLVFGIAIEIIDGMLEAGAGDVMEKASEGLNFVVGKVPDNKGDADAVGEDGIEILEVIDGAIIHGGHTDVF